MIVTNSAYELQSTCYQSQILRLKLSQNNVYKETVKTFLAGIKIAWRIDPKLWHRVIIKPSFWEKISSELEEMAGWTKQDEKLVDIIVANFKDEAATLSTEKKLERLEQILRGGWKQAKAHASVRQKITALMRRLRKKS